MNTGEKIRKIRKSKNLSMKQLGNLVNLSEQAISQYERGLRKISLENILKISEVLQVPLKELYIAEDEEINKVLKRLPNTENMNKLEKVLIHVDMDKEMDKKLKESVTEEEYKKIKHDELLKDIEEYTNCPLDKLDINENSAYKNLILISKYFDTFKNIGITLTPYKDKCSNDPKIMLLDNKDTYIKIFNSYEEAESFFNEINHGIQSSEDRLKYYDKNNT